MGELAQAFRDLDEKKVKEHVQRMIDNGVPVLDIIDECNEGMVAVGDLFAQKTYFISQLIYSAEILKGVMASLDHLLAGEGPAESKGTVVIGTVKGDIHDIGKNIVVTLLRGAGFEVIDLGVDVPAERFVETVQKTGARVVGMSALLSFTYPEMKSVVDAFIAANLRDQVKILIGGAPVNEQVRAFSGADYAAQDAVAGVTICKEIYA